MTLNLFSLLRLRFALPGHRSFFFAFLSLFVYLSLTLHLSKPSKQPATTDAFTGLVGGPIVFALWFLTFTNMPHYSFLIFGKETFQMG